MTDQRRYRDEEIRKIFDLATRGDDVGSPPATVPDGLTLAELQDVGREVGVSPARVASAAAALDGHQEVLPRGRTLGMPTSVGRVVDLPRTLTDDEWELLVAELRATFGVSSTNRAPKAARQCQIAWMFVDAVCSPPQLIAISSAPCRSKSAVSSR